VVWTLGPVVILLAIAIPSFNLLTAQYSPPEADYTVKATGYQWYWGYEYQTEGELSFDALMLQESDRADYGKEDVAAYPRLLAVDNEVRCSRRQDRASAGDRRRRSARLRHAGLRREDGRCSRAVSTRPGSRPTPKASITASVPSFAARTTPTCRSRYASYPRNSLMLARRCG
jgi:hypothetical protein